MPESESNFQYPTCKCKTCVDHERREKRAGHTESHWSDTEDLLDALESSEARVRELEAELAEARKDTERINWFKEQVEVKTNAPRGMDRAVEPYDPQVYCEGATFREALDVAIRVARAKETKA